MSSRDSKGALLRPLAIVGMEGCGASIVARVLRRAGVFLGDDLNEDHLNAAALVEFDYHWTPPFLLGSSNGGVSGTPLERMREQLPERCAQHAAGVAGHTPWGWKHGPSMHLLAFYEQVLPGLRVVHVLRDGRAAALAQGAARRHTFRLAGAVLDGTAEPVGRDSPAWRGQAPTRHGGLEATPLRQAAFWAACNRAAADFGERVLGERYLCVRIEDLLERPRVEIERLLVFARLQAPVGDLIEELPRGSPADAWAQRSREERQMLGRLMEPELLRFGYVGGVSSKLAGDGVGKCESENAGEWAFEQAGGADSDRQASDTAAGLDPVGESCAPPIREPAKSADEANPSVEDLDWSDYDFIDLGCSTGGSLRYCRERMSVRRSVGVDIDPDKVARARRAGFDAAVGDATDLRLFGEVRFVTMMDFLEHLPGLDIVAAALESAARAATDFLFIRHPSFEGEEYLAELGLRQYWWDWSGHKAHIQIADYCQIFDRIGLTQYTIRYLGAVTDSTHDSIHAIDAVDPHGWSNQGRHDPAVHPPKPYIRFARPLWRSQEILVALRPFQAHEWGEVVGRLLTPTDAGL
jgi:SAM-dependent methyltransferase